ncbi:MAG: peptidoglycan DD-metalloendopeptidase family protein [Rikenellaceae bacterium]
MKSYISKIFLATLMAASAVSCIATQKSKEPSEDIVEEVVVEENRIFGILSDDYTITSDVIKQGETMGKILNSYGVSAVDIDKLDRVSSDIFSLRKIRGGNRYSTFVRQDSTQKLDYLVYEVNKLDYVVFSMAGDSISTYTGVKPSTARRMKSSAVIESSMWGAMMEAKLPYALAANIEDIYQWSVDFFAIQKGDNFTVIYDEIIVDDSVSIGVGQIWGAKFEHAGVEHYAIPFDQNDKVEFWEEDGGSLKKQMLKAPLKYSRISSTFSYARLHPIYKVYRPHTGVDYAAPAGTEVHSVSDGVVIFRGWGSGGAGNMVKIKHPNNITTGYLHLSKFANGLKVGSAVKQGQTIGYVGSTGASTGPHLDYRVWKGTTPINPLTIPQEPSEPISEQNRAAFEYVKSLIIDELNSQEATENPLTILDRAVIDSLAKTTLVADAGEESN